VTLQGVVEEIRYQFLFQNIFRFQPVSLGSSDLEQENQYLTTTTTTTTIRTTRVAIIAKVFGLFSALL
jgi:hypothetical protein